MAHERKQCHQQVEVDRALVNLVKDNDLEALHELRVEDEPQEEAVCNDDKPARARDLGHHNASRAHDADDLCAHLDIQLVCQSLGSAVGGEKGGLGDADLAIIAVPRASTSAPG